MPEKDELIEPIPVTMDEIVEATFADHPEPRDSGKEKIKKNWGGGEIIRLRTLSTLPPNPRKSRSSD